MSVAQRFAFADILTVLDALPVGVLMASPEGAVLHVNKALSALTGFANEEACALPCRHVLRSRACVAGCALGCGASNKETGNAHDPVALHSLEPGGSAFGLNNVSSFETDLLTLKKRLVPVRLTHFPVQDAKGNALFCLDIVEDLTELKVLEQRLNNATGHGRLVGRSAAMERIAALIPNIASASAPVLISGETGTGKDILAETLHKASQRSREPFIRLNVSPLSEDLLAQEIFGFSPTEGPSRPGRFQQATRGTLYISELADIPPGVQAGLIRYLDAGTILPVGSTREITPDVRLITATNREPAALVHQGIVSEELYHRLNVAHIALPPLRERKEDIEYLLRHFLEMYATRFKKNLTGFSKAARALLSAYEYPGNVRELKNIVEYAAMVCTASEVDITSLPAHFMQMAEQTTRKPSTAKRTKRG